jgi:hypothetical protein
MNARINKLNFGYSYCSAKTDNGILIVFTIPPNSQFQIGDVLNIDLFILNREQIIHNMTKGTSHKILVKDNDIHDLKIPTRHGTSRFPSIERRQGN